MSPCKMMRSWLVPHETPEFTLGSEECTDSVRLGGAGAGGTKGVAQLLIMLTGRGAYDCD